MDDSQVLTDDELSELARFPKYWEEMTRAELLELATVQGRVLARIAPESVTV